MADYIDREKMLNDIRSIKMTGHMDKDDYIDCIFNKIDEQPSADVVEVVRCEFYEHWDKHNNIINQCEVHQENTGKFYFCASGRGEKMKQKLTEPQDEFLVNLIDECDTLIKKYKNEAEISDYEYAQVDDSLLMQIEYVIFCADTFIKSIRGEL